MPGDRGNVADSTVDTDPQCGKIPLQPIDSRILQRRQVAILLRAQPQQPGLARVHHQMAQTGIDQAADEGLQLSVTITLIDTDPTLHRDRNGHRLAHRAYAIGDARRFQHQTGAEAARLHPIAGTTDVEIDLVVTGRLRQRGAARQVLGLAAAELDRQRMFLPVISEQALPIAVEQRGGGDHFRVQPHPRRQLAEEITTMTVGPVHHGRDRHRENRGRHSPYFRGMPIGDRYAITFSRE